MSWIVPAAKTAIAQTLQRLDGAVKTREGERGIEYRIEGNPDMLLARAAVKTEPSDQSAAAADAEIDQLRAENADLRAKLEHAEVENKRLRAEIARLKGAHEKVAEEIAAAQDSNEEPTRTEDHIVTTAFAER
jgi:septal ring factor EnvC (AmiA/AmiB activator)